ncbi:3-oxoacyl-ACP reductase FabG [Pseudonocardia halophobica]|uniref:3-oxoacyl-[acyl-carrier-protein] reductase n=1 Tax=Pseudonocardia halophobica TaxID=29401 RepID=A0A9W6L8C7_9PSEU|nr:3-oxoacyl-ACP reductase FabG [Pseudonocardia halophobica]GLL13850.1 3-oxoacyl-[acyl-carrier-protein] reductase [Pseudonocardia halophobica]
MELLAGRAAVVTGGAAGIGLAIARTFAAHGASVVIGDRDGEAAESAAKELGERVTGVACDVLVPEEVDALVRTCVDQHGSLDVMVNNAGILRDGTLRRMTLEDFEAVVDVHLRGCWLGVRAASLVMREQGRGAMINMSSISGKVGMMGQTNYSAAKAGIVGLTKAAAKELGHLGIRVNAIQPGIIATAMTADLREDILEAKRAEVPLGRIGEPDEVANVALFLASDLSSYMTGTVLEVTGGRHI